MNPSHADNLCKQRTRRVEPVRLYYDTLITIIVFVVTLVGTLVLVIVGAHPGALFQHRLRLHRLRPLTIGRVLCAENGIFIAEDAVTFGRIARSSSIDGAVVMASCDIIFGKGFKFHSYLPANVTVLSSE